MNLGLRLNAYTKNLSRIIYLTNESETFKYKGKYHSITDNQINIHKEIKQIYKWG